MTLNITILTPLIVYQSTDYRLYDLSTRSPLSTPSTKVVIVKNVDWTAFVTYAGIGKVGSKSTADYVRDWLGSVEGISFSEAVERIRCSASDWIRQVTPWQEHTFVIAGFVDGVATAFVVSNYERWQGNQLDTVQGEFVTSVVTAASRTRVLVTGISAAVPRYSRKFLERLARRLADDPGQVRRALARANRRGAAHSPGRISSDCLVYSQPVRGPGSMQAFGDSRTDPAVFLVVPGAQEAVKAIADQHFGIRQWTVRQAAFGDSHSQSWTPPLCRPSLVALEWEALWDVVELDTVAGGRAVARAVNLRGVVVGEGAQVANGPQCPCVWRSPNEIEFLPSLGGLSGQALDINDAGVIVGTAETPDRTAHACLWNNGHLSDLSESARHHSGATAINRSGAVAGWVSIDATEGGQAHHRPARWCNSESPLVLEDLEGEWGEVIDINDEGQMVITSHAGFQADAWLWDGHAALRLKRPGQNVRAFLASHISGDGSIMGSVVSRSGQRGVAALNQDGSRMNLSWFEDGEVMTAANDQGVMVGYRLVDNYRVPWVKGPGQSGVTFLPRFRYHHCQPTMISETSRIVGFASADSCTHPLLWTAQ